MLKFGRPCGKGRMYVSTHAAEISPDAFAQAPAALRRRGPRRYGAGRHLHHLDARSVRPAICGARSLRRQNASSEVPDVLALTPTFVPTEAVDQPLIGLVSGHKGNDSGAVCPGWPHRGGCQPGYRDPGQGRAGANGFQVELLDEFDKQLGLSSRRAGSRSTTTPCEDYGPTATGFKGRQSARDRCT